MSERIRPEVAVQVGQRIRALRTHADLTVVRLAERSGVSRRMLTEIEQGKANPSLGTVDRIASALGTTFAGLVELSGSPSPEGVAVWSTDRGSWGYLLKATETDSVSVELWKWRILAGDGYRTNVESAAADSIVHVDLGTLAVGQPTRPFEVRAGESARVTSREPVVFGPAGEVVEFLWVVTVPRT
ncbi:helix-turn-helix transcriptional regulator [Brevibacterium samyangense]|uniref:XRE family transcriptional regulator n=1 Tax=Brevibacterium samyangense TaxID=366888 RepID=A0ABP5F2W4_9MICO